MSIRIGMHCLSLVAVLGVLHGCSSAPRFEHQFGASVHANLAAQVIDPAAAVNTNPAAGVDGAAAHAVHERYLRSFKEPDNSDSQPMVGRSAQQ